MKLEELKKKCLSTDLNLKFLEKRKEKLLKTLSKVQLLYVSLKSDLREKKCGLQNVDSKNLWRVQEKVEKIEEKLRKRGREVRSAVVGDLISRELKKVDKVAYIRFASVYKDFTELGDFKKEIRSLMRK